MLHTETLTNSTLELIKKLMRDAVFDKFVLVGGTSLSLQLGYRISVDIDLFSNETFNENELLEYLRINYSFELDFLDKETLKGEIDGVKIDCIAHKYPWLNAALREEDIRLAGFEDIAAMKLNAIVGNGTRVKDFIDLAYLSGKISLNTMLSSYQKKYQSNPILALKAIIYFEDINFNEPIKMTDKKRYNWKNIKKQIEQMISLPDTIFEDNEKR